MNSGWLFPTSILQVRTDQVQVKPKYVLIETEYLSHKRSKINLRAREKSQEKDSIVPKQHVLEREVAPPLPQFFISVKDPLTPLNLVLFPKKESVAPYWLSWPAALSLCDANTWETDGAGSLNFEKP